MPVGTLSTIRRSRYWKGFERRFASADSTCKRNEAAFELMAKGEARKRGDLSFRFLFAYEQFYVFAVWIVKASKAPG
jgi:hypothetical protein